MDHAEREVTIVPIYSYNVAKEFLGLTVSSDRLYRRLSWVLPLADMSVSMAIVTSFVFFCGNFHSNRRFVLCKL